LGSRQNFFVTDYCDALPEPDTECMRVHVTRRGGVAGVALHATFDTAQLAGADATRIEAALRDLPWDRPIQGPTGPDRFRYEVVADVGDHERRVVLGESEIPAALRPLLALLADRGQIRPASAE
jgi:hypothetical protein